MRDASETGQFRVIVTDATGAHDGWLEFLQRIPNACVGAPCLEVVSEPEHGRAIQSDQVQWIVLARAMRHFRPIDRDPHRPRLSRRGRSQTVGVTDPLTGRGPALAANGRGRSPQHLQPTLRRWHTGGTKRRPDSRHRARQHREHQAVAATAVEAVAHAIRVACRHLVESGRGPTALSGSGFLLGPAAVAGAALRPPPPRAPQRTEIREPRPR